MRNPTVRFATFNTSLFRNQSGQLAAELERGSEHAQATAAIIQTINPDVILLNEFDYDAVGKSAELFLNNYLNVNTLGLKWSYHFSAPVNTGIDSKLDLDSNGKLATPNDAWGFGTHPGQYGMLVISKYPIDIKSIRTFQMFRWSQMPGALQPMDQDGAPYYPQEVWLKLRLSSKSHFDVPIQINGTSVHFIVAHPTPPVFDGPEDRNGKRNHDEIRLLRDYTCSEFDGSYIVDDQGRNGALPNGSHFVIAGDLNADPNDGDGLHAVIKSLLQSPSVNSANTPSSPGAVDAAKNQAKRNTEHSGDPAHDTGDFNDESVGNLRIDYVIASKTLVVADSGVYWPAKETMTAEQENWLAMSDHHPVWIDVVLPTASSEVASLDATNQRESASLNAPAVHQMGIIEPCQSQPLSVPANPCASKPAPLFRRSSWFKRFHNLRIRSSSPLLSR